MIKTLILIFIHSFVNAQTIDINLLIDGEITQIKHNFDISNNFSYRYHYSPNKNLDSRIEITYDSDELLKFTIDRFRNRASFYLPLNRFNQSFCNKKLTPQKSYNSLDIDFLLSELTFCQKYRELYDTINYLLPLNDDFIAVDIIAKYIYITLDNVSPRTSNQVVSYFKKNSFYYKLFSLIRTGDLNEVAKFKDSLTQSQFKILNDLYYLNIIKRKSLVSHLLDIE